MGLGSGYNETNVTDALNDLNTYATNLFTNLENDFKTFVNTISEHWASPYAVKVMRGPSDGETKCVKDALKSIIDNAESTFKSINASINSAATVKAEENGAIFNKVAYRPYTQTTSFDSIVDNINGDVGVDKDEALSAANTLSLSDYTTEFNNIRNCLSKSGILSIAVQEALNTSISTINSGIKTDINNIVTAVKDYIVKTVNVNGDSDGKIKQAFTLSE